jgi:hypothetical protein
MIELPKRCLKRTTDPRLLVVTIGLVSMLAACFLLGLTATADARHTILTALPWMVAFVSACLLPLYLSDRRYQVGFDDNGVFMRMPGFRWEALLSKGVVERDHSRKPGILGWFGPAPVSFMPYDKIDHIEVGQIDRRVGGPARHSPNAAFYLIGEATPAGAYQNMIGVDLDSFRLDSVRELQRALASKRPDLTPEQWTRL